MNRNKTVLLGASALAAGAIVAGGVNLATAATGGDGGTTGSYGMRGPGGPGMADGMAGHGHTSVTGTEKTKVVDAVKAKYSDVTVVDVRQDEDGSYDVMGTQAGKPVMLEVSKDLATVELRTGPAGGPMGHGPMGDRDGDGPMAPPAGDATPSTTT